MLVSMFITTLVVTASLGSGLDKVLVGFIPLVAVVSGAFITKMLFKIKIMRVIKLFTVSMVLFYVQGSILTLGSKNYPAIFIWSDDVTPESIGFPSRWGLRALRIINTFMEKDSVSIYADDNGILNALAGENIASRLLHQRFCSPNKLLNSNNPIVIIILRNFLPEYIAHRYTKLSVEKYKQCIDLIKRTVLNIFDLVYYDNNIEIYFFDNYRILLKTYSANNHAESTDHKPRKC